MGAVADGIGRVWLDTTLSNADALWPWLADDDAVASARTH